jgi:hypothetical protein
MLYSQNEGEDWVAFGSNDPNSSMDATSVQQLGQNSANITNSFQYPTADIHNHPDNTPPSAGDVYSMISMYNQHNSFNTRYLVTPNGTVYAFIITNANAFDAFISTYPPLINPPYAPTFPTTLNNEYNDIAFDSNTNSQAAYENALSFMLDKYNVGIALT